VEAGLESQGVLLGIRFVHQAIELYDVLCEGGLALAESVQLVLSFLRKNWV
jgi:hypothetical protein